MVSNYFVYLKMFWGFVKKKKEKPSYLKRLVKKEEGTLNDSKSSYKSDEQYSTNIPPHIQSKVWKRDNGKCVNCSKKSDLEFVFIESSGGKGLINIDNIQILCLRCSN